MSVLAGQEGDLHGSAPDTCRTAVLFIDVISDFGFPGGDELLKQALRIAPNLRALRERAKEEGVPLIYVNDNFGRWRSSFEQLVKRCLSRDSPGRVFVEQIAPGQDDYVVLKPKNSGFFQTPLDLLLKHLGASSLILCGFCTESCILFTAQDAYMRDFQIAVPADCVASQCGESHEATLKHLESTMKADLSRSGELSF